MRRQDQDFGVVQKIVDCALELAPPVPKFDGPVTGVTILPV